MSGRQKHQDRHAAAVASPKDKFTVSQLGSLAECFEQICLIIKIRYHQGIGASLGSVDDYNSGIRCIEEHLLENDFRFFTKLAKAMQWMAEGPAVIDQSAFDLLSAIGSISTEKLPGVAVSLEETLEGLETAFPRPSGYEASNIRRLGKKLGITFPIAPGNRCGI